MSEYKVYGKRKIQHPHQKVEWDVDMLDDALIKYNGNLVAVGKHFGVSDNTIRKQCRKFDIEFKEYKRAAATMAV